MGLITQIQDIKKQKGDELVILGHYYQRKDILDLADYKGDSFGLSKTAANLDKAQYIVFAGVHFMAESAAILAQSHQIVQLPSLNAGCPMADMADINDVRTAWKLVTDALPGKKIIPITYMNSSADIKAFCGEHDGAVCTSSNADMLFKWALEQGDMIFFFPDEYLGRNTANKIGIGHDRQLLWNPHEANEYTTDALNSAQVIIWRGYCHVHRHFNAGQVKAVKAQHPDAVVIAHPECPEEVISLADYSGSTSFIDTYIRKAKDGATIAIATEINMIQRLAMEFPNKNIIPVSESLCPDMFQITLENLKATLDQLGKRNVITVSEKVKRYGAAALRRMIEVTDRHSAAS